MPLPNIKFYFSVEGETEKWYLERLQKLINASEGRSHNADFRIKKTSPLSFAKGLPVLSDVKANHFFDYECTEEEGRFKRILEDMSKAERLGKQIKYFSCYSNLTFELWIILHKMECNASVADPNGYLPIIKTAFRTHYQGLKEYKEEKHFKAILDSITLEDVKSVVFRAQEIMKRNSENKKPMQHRKWKWYQDNPATEVGTVVADILQQCGLM